MCATNPKKDSKPSVGKKTCGLPVSPLTFFVGSAIMVPSLRKELRGRFSTHSPSYSENIMKKSIFLSVSTFFVLSFTIAFAQEENVTIASDGRFSVETKAKDTQAGKDAIKGLKLEKEYKPSLPSGFGNRANVTAVQREEVYKILTEYHGLIDMLEFRVKLLKEERDAKVDAVLTPDQQQRLGRPIRRILAR